MKNILYRLAIKADVQTLVNTRIRFAIELSGPQPEDKITHLHSLMTAYFTQAIEDGTCDSFIASVDGQTAGIGSVNYRQVPGNFRHPSGKWGYIMNMYTYPEFRRMGICTQILNLLIDAGKARGVGAFELHATEAGEPVYVQQAFIKHTEPTYRKIVEL